MNIIYRLSPSYSKYLATNISTLFNNTIVRLKILVIPVLAKV